jgi:hypothetical protein
MANVFHDRHVGIGVFVGRHGVMNPAREYVAT